MKKLISIILALLLCGCAAVEEGATTDPTTAAPTTTATTEPTAEPATDPTTEPETDPTEAASLPYLLKIASRDEKIYSAPAYQGDLVGYVEEAGTYTIVEEHTENGIIWGRLKSGAGWVNVTDIRKNTDLYISVGEGGRDALGTKTEYALSIRVTAYREITDVKLYPDSLGDSFEDGPAVYTAQKLKPGEAITAYMEFPGDMSVWVVSFTCDGERHAYGIMLSGLDGSPYLTEPLS